MPRKCPLAVGDDARTPRIDNPHHFVCQNFILNSSRANCNVHVAAAGMPRSPCIVRYPGFRTRRFHAT